VCTASNIKQSDADAAAAACEQRTRETCVRARYRTIYGRRDIVRLTNLRSIFGYHVIDMITTTNLENLKKSGYLKVVREKAEKYQKSGKVCSCLCAIGTR